MYDNVGRDADQIHAARYNLVTRSDLKRWARRDAEPFRETHPLPVGPWPALDLSPYLDALAAAQSPAEVETVTEHVLDAAEPTVRALADYLLAAARWQQQNRGAAPGSPSNLLMTAASRALSALAFADESGLRRLRAAYDPTPSSTPSSSSQSAATATPPPAPPAPGDAPRR